MMKHKYQLLLLTIAIVKPVHAGPARATPAVVLTEGSLANGATYYSLPKGSPGIGFVVFDPNQAGRTNPLIHPPAIPATFPTKMYNPATDY